jgi:lipopolysaccharide export system permease protein
LVALFFIFLWLLAGRKLSFPYVGSVDKVRSPNRLRASRDAAAPVTILTRYILMDLLKVFSITLAALTLVLVLVLVGKEAIGQGLGPGPVLRLIPFLLPTALVFAIPATALFAVCLVYGRMSSANEIVAIKSLGISPWRPMWPAALLGLGLSVVTVVLNDVAFTWGYRGLHRVVMQSVEEIAYGVLRKQRTYSTHQFSISVKDVVGKRLIAPTITQMGNGKIPTITITAQEARLKSDLEKDTLRILFTNSVIEAADKGDTIDGILPGEEELTIPLSDASRKGMSGSPSHIALRRIPQAAQSQKQKIRELEETLAAEGGLALVMGDFRRVRADVWQFRDAEISMARANLNRLHTEPWKRTAAGFSCLCFICVGAPLAVWLRNTDFMTSFICCFAPILGGYYPLFYVALLRTKAGAFPPIAVWGGNLACIVVGYWLMRRMQRT